MLLRVFPCFVVLAKKKKKTQTFPSKVPFVHQQRMCPGGEMYLYKGKKKNDKKTPDVASNSPVLALEHAKLNDNASAQVK